MCHARTICAQKNINMLHFFGKAAALDWYRCRPRFSHLGQQWRNRREYLAEGRFPFGLSGHSLAQPATNLPHASAFCSVELLGRCSRRFVTKNWPPNLVEEVGTELPNIRLWQPTGGLLAWHAQTLFCVVLVLCTSSKTLPYVEENLTPFI